MKNFLPIIFDTFAERKIKKFIMCRCQLRGDNLFMRDKEYSNFYYLMSNMSCQSIVDASDEVILFFKDFIKFFFDFKLTFFVFLLL